ncbi:signal peptide peptidase SppA [Candidatus Poribacteria bacterium]|nr:signal peptide peptidase SppA [Candidatus Poribacteria bacterium]MYA99713.1 signal peptide peptidase SppA [Candidatus Poribacteria bacterium]
MKLLQTCTFLLTLLLLVSPVFAEEKVAEETPPPTKKYVEFTLSGTYADTKTVSTFGTSSTKTLRGLFKKLDALKTDDEIAGVIFKIEGVSIGWAVLQEIRTKLNEFHETEKETIGYLESGGNAEYLLAATMDRIVLMPTGSLNLTGLRAEVIFYKGLLDKLDIEADMLAMGKYKSGVEPYMRDGMSDEFRESMTALLDDLYTQFLNHIAENRDSITEASVANLINSGPFTAEEAEQKKLVDALQYYDELVASLKAASPDEDVQVAKPGYERKRKVPDMNSFAGLMQLFSILNPPQRAQAASENQIALIYASGPILPDIDSPFISMSAITPKELKKAFEKTRTDDSVQAVVLRIDSPGGSALASDLIWREVMLTQREKPVVVSMGNVAASGGYYIAMAAGTIVAHPSTLTGSIGVFGGKLNLKGLYNKAGLTKEIIAHGQNATLYSDYGGFTPTERERVEKMMKTVYENFVSKAATGRNKSFDEIDEIAQGRVWTGKQAKEIGLVDEIGGLDTALSIAKKQAGFAEEDEVGLIVLPKQRPFFEQILEQMIEDTESSIRRGWVTQPLQFTANHPVLSMLGTPSQHIITWLSLFGFEDGTQIVTILPYDILIR